MLLRSYHQRPLQVLTCDSDVPKGFLADPDTLSLDFAPGPVRGRWHVPVQCQWQWSHRCRRPEQCRAMHDGEHKARQAQQALAWACAWAALAHSLSLFLTLITYCSLKLLPPDLRRTNRMGRRLPTEVQAAGCVAGLAAVGVVAYVAWRRYGRGARSHRLPGPRLNNAKQARPCWQGTGQAFPGCSRHVSGVSELAWGLQTCKTAVWLLSRRLQL